MLALLPDAIPNLIYNKIKEKKLLKILRNILPKCEKENGMSQIREGKKRRKREEEEQREGEIFKLRKNINRKIESLWGKRSPESFREAVVQRLAGPSVWCVLTRGTNLGLPGAEA